jgi:O-antigen/teichoic acid export membrane protein
MSAVKSEMADARGGPREGSPRDSETSDTPAWDQSHDALRTDHLQADLKGRSVRGGVVTVASQGGQFLVQSVSTVVLARLLVPADFGIVAIVTVVTGLAMGFADLGLSEATIQREDITQDQVSTLFWINAAIGLGLTLITIALAPVLAWVYQEPRLVAITICSSLTFLINGFRAQPDALLKRRMRYSALAIKDIISNALGVSVAIMVALRGDGYWALVAAPLTTNLCQLMFSWLMVGWRPNLPRRNTKVGSMVTFGGNVATSYFIFNLNRSADNALIGWYWKAAPLGLYSRAYNLLMLPLRQLSAPVASVAIPAFSRIQNDPERYARYYLATIRVMMWIIAPLFGFLFVAAEPVIVLVLGRQWLEAAPVFRILSISGPGQLLLDTTIWILVSRGRSEKLLRLLLYISPFILGSFLVGLPFGIKGVAVSYSVVLLLILPWILKFSFRDTQLTLEALGWTLFFPISTGLAGVFVAELGLHFINPQRVIAQLFVIGCGFLAAYFLSALAPSVREEMMSFRKLFGEFRLSN